VTRTGKVLTHLRRGSDKEHWFGAGIKGSEGRCRQSRFCVLWITQNTNNQQGPKAQNINCLRGTETACDSNRLEMRSALGQGPETEISATQQRGQEAGADQLGQGSETAAAQQWGQEAAHQNQDLLASTPESQLDATRSPSGLTGRLWKRLRTSRLKTHPTEPGGSLVMHSETSLPGLLSFVGCISCRLYKHLTSHGLVSA